MHMFLPGTKMCVYCFFLLKGKLIHMLYLHNICHRMSLKVIEVLHYFEPAGHSRPAWDQGSIIWRLVVQMRKRQPVSDSRWQHRMWHATEEQRWEKVNAGFAGLESMHSRQKGALKLSDIWKLILRVKFLFKQFYFLFCILRKPSCQPASFGGQAWPSLANSALFQLP